MEEFKRDIRNLFNESESLLRKEVELLKMELIEKAAHSGGKILSLMLIVRISLIFLGLFGVCLVMLIGYAMESYMAGVFITTGFYALVAAILLIFREKLIVRPFMNYQLRDYVDEMEQKAHHPTPGTK